MLKSGRMVLLELAPADPRSLMQGDYMILRYTLADSIVERLPRRGYCVIKLDSNNIASKVRFQSETTPLNNGEYLIEFTSPNKGILNIGAESYFFQEGEAEKYEKAKYGAVRIDDKGNSLLTGLYDDQRRLIE